MAKICISLQDEEYPKGEIKEIREISRAFIFDEKGNFALHHVIRDDLFGKYDYYETPGGGIDAGESKEEACIRECREETGFAVKIVKEVGFVDDFYNLIGRENHNHFFLCAREGNYLGKKMVSQGDLYIHETLWLPLKEVIARYESVPSGKLTNLVKARELPLWLSLESNPR